MVRAVPTLTDIHHSKLCYSKDRYCGHPRQCGIYNFGNGEIAVMHHRARSTYRTLNDIRHGWDDIGYKRRCQIVLQRSLDHARTWPSESDVVVWNYNRPWEELRELLWRADDLSLPRETIDLSSPNAVIYFGRALTGRKNKEGEGTFECFAWRSGDRGHTWEQVPTRVSPPTGMNYVHIDGGPLAKFDDGTQLAVASIGGDDRDTGLPESVNSGLGIYGTDDNGRSWSYIAEVTRDATGRGRPTYGALVLLPSGRLQCYMSQIGGIRHGIQMCYSDDGGYSWSEPQPLVTWGQSPWAALTRKYAWSGARRSGPRYRAPWPLRLRDGRIVVVFDRRHPPFGMGLVVSEDDGATWSAEAVIRADASDWDLGYPVATELDDGRIFTAYYYMEDDGNNFGGTRYVAGSHFRLG